MYGWNLFERCCKGNSFPFTKGEGLAKALEKLGYKAILETSSRGLQIKSIKNCNVVFEYGKNKDTIFKFTIIRADNIRKKFKVSFHSNILKIMTGNKKNKSKTNSSLKLPQNFITNVNIMDNSLVMDLTYEELLLNIKGENKNNFCIELDENSNWNIIKNMTYKELIEAYLSSAEFEKSIIDLKIKSEKKNKKISALYIEAYINLALTYTDFYSSIPLKKAKSLSVQTNRTNISSDNTNTTNTENSFSSINSGNPFSLNLIDNNTIFPQNDTRLLTEEENYNLNENLDSINNLEERDERNFIIKILEQSKKKFL